MTRSLRVLLCAICLGGSFGANAARVPEQLDYEYYEVDGSGRDLRSAINAASPIREDGETFHGYTKWNVKWRFWWNEDEDGCTINLVRVELSGTITLPQLVDATASNAARFEPYIANLETHELGHYEHGRRAAAEIDDYLQELPTMASCAILEREANAGAHRIIRRYNAEDKRYDAQTEHGATQGARLR